MNAVQIKTLRDGGFSEAVINVMEEITEVKTIDLVTKKDLEVTKLELEKQILQVKLELQKEIEQVKLEIQQVKLELQKEIEQVKLEIQQVKLELLKEIDQVKVELYKVANTQMWKFVAILITLLSPFYALLIKTLL